MAIRLLIFIIVIIAGYMLLVKPTKENNQVRDTVDAMMQAYMQKDLQNALSYTNLKNYSEEGLASYYIKYLKETSQIDSFMADVLARNTEVLDDMALNLIREYEIKKITVKKDNAVISIDLTIPDYAQVSQAVDGKAVEGGLNAVLAGIGNIDVLSKITDIFNNPPGGTILGALGDTVNEYIDGGIGNFLVSYNMEISAADDKNISLKIKAYKEDEDWVIVFDEVLKELMGF